MGADRIGLTEVRILKILHNHQDGFHFCACHGDFCYKGNESQVLRDVCVRDCAESLFVGLRKKLAAKARPCQARNSG